MKKKTIIVLGIIVVILVGLFITYKIMNSSKTIFLKGMNEVLNGFEENYDNLLNNEITKLSETQPILAEMNIKTKIDINDELEDENVKEIVRLINDFSADIKVGTDIKNKEISYVLNVLAGNEDEFNLEMMGKDKVLYFGVKQLFSKYVKIPFDDYDKLFETENIKDLTYLKDIVKKAVLNSFEESDFTKTSTNISIDGEKIKTNKVNYEVSEKSLYKIVLKVLKDMYKDNKSLDILAKYSDVDKDELKNDIKDMIDRFEDQYKEANSDKLLDMNIYSKGLTNEIVRYELIVKDDYSTSNFNISKLNNKTVILFNEDDEEILKSVTTTDKDKSKTIITIDDIKITINGSGTDEKVYKYEVSEIEQIKISGEFKIINKEITKNKEYKNGFSFNINIKQNNNEMVDFTINIDGKTYIGKDLKITIPENSIEYTEITEEDLNEIIENFNSLPLVKDLTSTMINE